MKEKAVPSHNHQSHLFLLIILQHHLQGVHVIVVSWVFNIFLAIDWRAWELALNSSTPEAANLYKDKAFTNHLMTGLKVNREERLV